MQTISVSVYIYIYAYLHTHTYNYIHIIFRTNLPNRSLLTFGGEGHPEPKNPQTQLGSSFHFWDGEKKQENY